jgi:hypothetical protein
MINNQSAKREAIREAIKDELSVLRVVNSALRNSATNRNLHRELEVVQQQSMTVLRCQLSLLHPAHQDSKTKDTARASARADRRTWNE